MANELTVPSEQPLVIFDDKNLADVMKSSDFLPRLQVMTSNSDAVKEGKIAQGVYALVFGSDQMKDLGKEVLIVSYSLRPKALRIPNDGSNPMSYYKMESPEFKNVQVDSNSPNSGCAFGPEFLVWIPSEECFATFFLGSKTGRRAAPVLMSMMKKDDQWVPAVASLGVIFIKKQRFSWHGPQITSSSESPSVLPEPEELAGELKKFNNPPETLIEKKEVASGEQERAR